MAATSPRLPSASAPQGDEPDPSMDDILASIRRILNEDEKTTKPPPSGVLVLDPSMIVEEGEPPAGSTSDEPLDEAPPANDTGLKLGVEEATALATADDPVRSGLAFPDMPSPPPTMSRDAVAPDSPLVAPAAAAAAANSVGSLVRTLAAERSAAVTRGGLTIEDLVREEVRPVLKEWLDTHLPPLVERMVRAELERVVGRSVG